MGVPFGHNTAFGFGEQGAFDTGVPSDAYLEINSKGLKREQAPVGKPKLTGVGVRDYVPSKRGVTGPVEFALPYEGAEIMLKHLTGGVPSSVLIGTFARRNTFPFSANRYPGLSLNIGRDTDEMTHAFRYTGCQPTKWGLKSEIEDHVMLNADFVGRDEEMIPAEVPNYPVPNFINWNDLEILLLGAGGGVTVKGRSLEFNAEDPAAEDRFSLLSRLRHGIGREGERKILGKIEVEFEYGVNYINFRDQEEIQLVATWKGPEVEAGINYELSIVLPRVVLSGSTPNAKDMGPLVHE